MCVQALSVVAQVTTVAAFWPCLEIAMMSTTDSSVDIVEGSVLLTSMQVAAALPDATRAAFLPAQALDC